MSVSYPGVPPPTWNVGAIRAKVFDLVFHMVDYLKNSPQRAYTSLCGEAILVRGILSYRDTPQIVTVVFVETTTNVAMSAE